MPRYALLIDGAYFRKVLRNFGEPRVDFLKLSDAMGQGDERLRTYYYDCAPHVSVTPTEDEKQRQASFDRFRTALEFLPRFQVRLGRLARFETPSGPQFQQKKVDILLALDLAKLSLEHQIQRAVLIAGDSDFVPAIEIARDAGVVVQLYYHRPPYVNDELLRACDERVPVSQSLVDAIAVSPRR
jgi:uncharacterized LabA/DUF88 family protein